MEKYEIQRIVCFKVFNVDLEQGKKLLLILNAD